MQEISNISEPNDIAGFDKGSFSIDEKVDDSIKDMKEKGLGKSFFVLWQGQLVSMLGDVIYSIALGFWVLAVTGSTGLMGTLMAASTLPGVLVSPVAGVLVDRYDRRKLMIIMDVLRGISITAVGIAAYTGVLAVWMVFAAGMLMSICGAFFTPAVNSAVPDIVPKSKITSANSLLQMVFPASNIIGNAVGGFIYKALGASIMFLFNGLSFLFSGTSILFTKVPKINQPEEKKHFITDMKEGFSFVWKFKGLKYALLMTSVVNFFAFIAITLLIPLFERSPELGSGLYGVAMACFTGGTLLGFIFASIIKIPAHKRTRIFFVSCAIFCIGAVIFSSLKIVLVMLILLPVSGFFNAIVNVLLMSSVQLTVPQNMRGKVFSLMGMVTQGLTPFAMALGGILAEFIPIRIIMALSFLIVFIVFMPFAFVKSFSRFINFDPDKEKLEDIL
ncbi:MAG: MFS transporter [Bacillota bacterium]|nr:MFS transporter [Bacillota bacterium]